MRWYLAALLGYPILLFAGSRLDVLLGGVPIWPPPDLADLHMPFWFLLVVNAPFVLGEEFGWRGFALPRLQARRSALSATLILWVLWGLWHVPSFLTRHSLHDGLSFPLWMIWLLEMTIALTWIHNNTGGSVLLVWLYHATMNYGGFLIPATMRGQVFGSVLILVAVLCIVVFAGPARFVRQER